MSKMNWIPSSKGTALVVLVALALAAVGTAGAISVSDDGVPNETQVGERVSATITVEDPFVNMSDQWTLEGSTELRNVSWTVTILQQGEQIQDGQTVYGKQTFKQQLDVKNGGDTIRIKLTGETPPVKEFSYDPPQSYVLYDLHSVTGNSRSALANESVHHYTKASKRARNAIDNASRVIDETNTTGEPVNELNQSISSFENSNFNNSIQIANDARKQAEKSQQSQQRTQTILMGVGAIVVLVLVGGGVYYWRSQQDDYGKLQ